MSRQTTSHGGASAIERRGRAAARWWVGGTAALMMACSPAMTPWPSSPDDPRVLEVGLERALAAVDGGVALEVEREVASGEVHVEVWDGDSVIELVFDASNGQLRRQAPEELSAEERASLPQLLDAVAAKRHALREAVSLARDRHGDAVHEVELVLAGDALSIEIELEDGSSDEIPLP